MSSIASNPPLSQLAWRLEADIRSRGLKPGDRYLTTTEAGQMLGVSSSTANRALRLLAKKKLIERRQRRGTVIGSGIQNGGDHAPALDCIEILFASDHDPDYATGELLDGIQEVLPGVSVRLNYLSAVDPLAKLRQCEVDAVEANRMIGYIAVSSPREVYQALAEQAAPAVVLGTLWSNVTGLSTVESDNTAMGRLCVEYALERGRSSIAFLALDSWYPGNNDMFASMTSTAAARGLSADAITVCSMPLDESVAKVEVCKLLAGPRPPGAIFALYPRHADGAAEAVREAGLRVGEDVVIICDAFPLDWQRKALPYPTIRGCKPYRHTAAGAVRVLLKMAAGEPPRHVNIPVELYEPKV